MFDPDLDLNEFCGLTDDELAECARSSKDAANAVILRFSRLIFTKARLYAASRSDVDDLCQEGLIGLMKAMDSFDPEKGAKFATFAEVCINNQMRTYLARLRKIPDSQSLDELLDEQIPDNDTPESIYVSKEMFSELWYAVEHVLSESEKQVFCLCIQGFSYGETAEKLGISVKSVDNAMQRAKRKIRSYCVDRS